MALKINTSFKETDEEMKLYLQVITSSDKSAYIKEALKFYIKYRHLLPMLEQKCAEKRKNNKSVFISDLCHDAKSELR